MAEGKKVSSVSFFNSRLTSIISISLVLFLLGLVFLIGLLGNKLSVYVKENISFSIVLKDNQKEADIKKMQKTLDALPYIKSTEYISKEQAVKELEEELGENPETFLGFNPLQASIEVKLHSEYANVDSLQLIEKKIKKYNYIRFATREEIDTNMPLTITPEPDTTIRVLMEYKGLENSIKVEEQSLETPGRKGFVAVEWGGTEIK